MHAEGRSMTYIVAGFYTPDYERWVGPLQASLDQHNQPHDFVLVEKHGSSWEANTMAKAAHILAAMDRHPGKVIIWLDVDCIVLGDLSPLADIRGDVAFRMHSKFRRHHKGTRFRAQSGTMVFRPTPEARQFVENWRIASEKAPYAEIDQSSQVVAMAASINTSFVPLPLVYCVNPPERGTVPGAVIQHDSAAVHFQKVSRWTRYLGRAIGWRAA